MVSKLIFLTLLVSLSFSASLLSADNIATSDITVLFSPKDECGKAILEKIDSAKKSIELAIYHLTSRALSKGLIMAAKRGVAVRVFFDGENVREDYSKANFLKKNGVLVKFENGVGLMHNKFCVIDDEFVITGSYNWTTTADLKNDENVLFINSKELAKVYRMQFENYWQGTYADEAFYIDKNTLRKHIK